MHVHLLIGFFITNKGLRFTNLEIQPQPCPYHPLPLHYS